MMEIYICTWDADGIKGSRAQQGRYGHLAGRLLLEEGLFGLFGIRADAGTGIDALLAYGDNGKPYVKGRPDIYFNISHCPGAAVCVFAGSPVGADIESAARHITDAAVRRVMTERELGMLSGYRPDYNVAGDMALARAQEMPAEAGSGLKNKNPRTLQDKYDELCIRLWTLKESRAKYDGTGITGAFCRYGFTLDPEDISAPITSTEGGLHFEQYIISGSGNRFILSICTGPDEDAAGEAAGFHYRTGGLSYGK